jgi:hypothetical protein
LQQLLLSVRNELPEVVSVTVGRHLQNNLKLYETVTLVDDKYFCDTADSCQTTVKLKKL